MSRRGQRDSHGDKLRASLTDSSVDTAIEMIRRTQRRAMTALTKYTPSREATIAMLFNPDTIQRATAARNIVMPAQWCPDYTIQGVQLEINYKEGRCLPINTSALDLQYQSISPLFNFIDEVKAIHMRYEEVKGVLRWFNRNATINAVRYYWPTAMQLCPSPFRELQALPTRHNTPPGIGDMLQAIRDSAATWAGAQMLPSDVAPRPRDKMQLTFPSIVVPCGGQKYLTEVTYYSL